MAIFHGTPGTCSSFNAAYLLGTCYSMVSQLWSISMRINSQSANHVLRMPFQTRVPVPRFCLAYATVGGIREYCTSVIITEYVLRTFITSSTQTVVIHNNNLNVKSPAWNRTAPSLRYCTLAFSFPVEALNDAPLRCTPEALTALDDML
jgi:hypothetical protein